MAFKAYHLHLRVMGHGARSVGKTLCIASLTTKFDPQRPCEKLDDVASICNLNNSMKV